MKPHTISLLAVARHIRARFPRHIPARTVIASQLRAYRAHAPHSRVAGQYVRHNLQLTR